MKRLLIIGAGFLQRYVIKRAVELGYYVFTVDGNPQADGFLDAHEHKCIDIMNAQKCLEYAIQQEIDGVLTAATDYGVLTAAYIAQEMKLPGISMNTARMIKDKYEIRKRLSKLGTDDSAEFFKVTNDTDFFSLSNIVRYPVMIKPCDGSGSRGAFKVDSASSLKIACNNAIRASVTRKALIEPFFIGCEFGAECFVEKGKPTVLGIMKKAMTQAPYYAELGHTIPSGLSDKDETHIVKFVEKAVVDLNIECGAVNLDLLLDEKGFIHIVDVGARMGGNLIGSHIIPTATGFDYMGNLIRQAVGDPLNQKRTFTNEIATRLLALKPGKIIALPDFQKIERQYDVKIEHHLVVGNKINPYRTNLDGCGYIIALGGSDKKPEARAEMACRAVDNSISRV